MAPQQESGGVTGDSTALLSGSKEAAGSGSCVYCNCSGLPFLSGHAPNEVSLDLGLESSSVCLLYTSDAADDM
eukprot:467852-Prymnesium_polylepis.1